MNDPAVEAYLASVLAHGLKTDVTEENIDDYCSGLVDCLNSLPFNMLAEGDKDGILVPLPGDEIIILVWPKLGITEFRVIGDLEKLDKDLKEICCRIVLMTIGWTLQFLPGQISPAAGLSAGDSKENTFSFKDDGFGIA